MKDVIAEILNFCNCLEDSDLSNPETLQKLLAYKNQLQDSDLPHRVQPISIFLQLAEQFHSAQLKEQNAEQLKLLQAELNNLDSVLKPYFEQLTTSYAQIETMVTQWDNRTNTDKSKLVNTTTQPNLQIRNVDSYLNRFKIIAAKHQVLQIEDEIAQLRGKLSEHAMPTQSAEDAAKLDEFLYDQSHLLEAHIKLLQIHFINPLSDITTQKPFQPDKFNELLEYYKIEIPGIRASYKLAAESIENTITHEAANDLLQRCFSLIEQLSQEKTSILEDKEALKRLTELNQSSLTLKLQHSLYNIDSTADRLDPAALQQVDQLLQHLNDFNQIKNSEFEQFFSSWGNINEKIKKCSRSRNTVTLEDPTGQNKPPVSPRLPTPAELSAALLEIKKLEFTLPTISEAIPEDLSREDLGLKSSTSLAPPPELPRVDSWVSTPKITLPTAQSVSEIQRLADSIGQIIPDEFKTWFTQLDAALKKISEQDIPKLRLLQDIQFELHYAIRPQDYEVLLCYQHQSAEALLALKPDFTPLKPADLKNTALTAIQKHARNLAFHHPKEAALMIQLTYDLAELYKLPEEERKSQGNKFLQDPRFDCLKRHRGSLKIWESLENLSRRLFSTKKVEPEVYSGCIGFFKTKSHKLIIAAVNNVKA